MKLSIVDYGMGNLNSVANAFAALGFEYSVVNEPRGLKTADKIVLPGVGAFGEAMLKLSKHGWVDVLEEEVRQKKKPFLGICLGMQVLATTGTEYGIHQGFGWVPGIVKQLESSKDDFRLPHIGWNEVKILKKDGLYKGLEDVKDFYFVNSYAFHPDDPRVISGTCDYFGEFTASIEKENIYATQFHPEKSHKAGLTILANFASSERKG